MAAKVHTNLPRLSVVVPSAAPRDPGHAGAVRQDFRDTQSLDLEFNGSLEPEDPLRRRQREREAAIRGTPQDRVDFLLKKVFIFTPDFQYAVSAVEQLLSHAGIFPNAGGMRIIAAGGKGKDAIVRYFLEKYSPRRLGNTYVCPILHVNFRERTATSDILKNLLQQLQCVHKISHHISDLEDNLLEAMSACQTLGFFFNETQHLVYVKQHGKRSAARLAGGSGDWLKGFLDKAKRPGIFLGVPGWDEAFEADQQLKTRVPHRYEFSKIGFDAVYIAMLRALDAAIAMPEPAGLDEKTLAWDIYQVTEVDAEANWRQLIFLLSGAIFSASQAGVPRIERPDLSWSCQFYFGARKNPFGPPRQL